MPFFIPTPSRSRHCCTTPCVESARAAVPAPSWVETSAETQRDWGIFWMCPDLRQCWAGLGWVGLGHTNCAFITNYAPLIVTNYIWHLPPPATSHQQPALPTHSQPARQGERGHLRVGGWSSDFGCPRSRLMLFQLILFTFYVKQQQAILWAQVTRLKIQFPNNIVLVICVMCSGRAALLRPPPHPGVNFLPNNPRWYETILKLPARNINSNCPVRALCSCP